MGHCLLVPVRGKVRENAHTEDERLARLLLKEREGRLADDRFTHRIIQTRQERRAVARPTLEARLGPPTW